MIWIVLVAVAALAFIAGRRYARPVTPAASAQTSVANLRALNALLRTLTSSPDITRSLSELARRIGAIVPNDHVGLALLTNDREAYTTFAARANSEDAIAEPDPDLHFARGDKTLIDETVRTCEGRVVADLGQYAAVYLDANALKSTRLESLVMVPLVFEGEAIGTLNLVSRRRGAYTDDDLTTLKPVAEALAAAIGTRRLAQALARHQLADELADLTFAFANDMSGAIQAMIGGCELMSRQTQDPALLSGLDSLCGQARRLGDILDQMRRMVAGAGAHQQAGTPSRSM